MIGKHNDKCMKRITFYGYAELCTCTYCASLRAIMEREKKLEINSFKLEDDDTMILPQSDKSNLTQKVKE